MQKDSLSSQFRAVIIANPKSGGFPRNADRLNETLTFLREKGWKAELWLTKACGHARQLACEAVRQKANLVIAAGGDGTINEIIQELAQSETALGVLPMGTINVWAREIGIPLDIVGARDVLVNGQTRRVDLGRAKGRYFLLMAGVGLDGEVARAVERKPAKRWGLLGYILMGLWLGPGYPGFRVHLYLNRRRIRTNALQIIIGNTQLHSGFFKFTPRAKCDDGLLDVCLVRQRGVFGRIAVLWNFFRQRETRLLGVRYISCTAVRIRTFKPIAVQLDGDPAGDTPVIFTVAPSALKVVVPQKTPAGLFSK
jgi:diacylglycerol kinase (ATP)